MLFGNIVSLGKAFDGERLGLVERRLFPLTDPLELYSGCYVRASISFFAFNSNGNVGVTAGLGNIQKWADGEPLDAKDGDDFLS